MLDSLLLTLWPELLLVLTACVLFLLGALRPGRSRSLSPVLALLALVAIFVVQLRDFSSPGQSDFGFTNSASAGPLSQYIRLVVCVAGVLFVLLAWPTRVSSAESGGGGGGGNGALAVGGEVSEYFALMMLSLAGVLLTADAQNTILLFLGLELASIPTYIMVSISRPLAQAQEAGVKYFFLGAMSAALMLLGFSYLYGATGSIHLGGSAAAVEQVFSSQAGAGLGFTGLQELAVILLLAGFSFKMAAFPLHVYAADVYQGAASPVTALLSVVPKATGLVALIKVLEAVGGPTLMLPGRLLMLLAVIAALTMTVGNVLALLQFNVKRTMAYSSVAQSGYLLAGVAAAVALRGQPALQAAAIAGVLVYLATYAVMHTGVFAVLQQLPARRRFGEEATPAQLVERGSASAETFEDLAGYGRHHPALALAMAVCCLSLIGIPVTAGFLAKLLLARPLLDSGLLWLLVVLFINAAISAGYYLRLPATLFFRPLPETMTVRSPLVSVPGSIAAGGCALAVIAFGLVLPLSNSLTRYATASAASLNPAYEASLLPRVVPSGQDREMGVGGPRVRPPGATTRGSRGNRQPGMGGTTRRSGASLAPAVMPGESPSNAPVTPAPGQVP